MRTIMDRSTPLTGESSRKKWLPILLAVLIPVVILSIWQIFGLRAEIAGSRSPDVITADDLAEIYGMKVRLIGVTAGGGMVDVRLKVLDSTKAALLLKVPANLPSLYVKGEALTIPTDELDELILEDDGVVFLMYANRGALVSPGVPIVIRFGEVELEPILAQ